MGMIKQSVVLVVYKPASTYTWLPHECLYRVKCSRAILTSWHRLLVLLQPDVVRTMVISTAMGWSYVHSHVVSASTVTWTTTSWQQLTGLPLRLLSTLYTCKLLTCCTITFHHICTTVLVYHNYLLCVCMACTEAYITIYSNMPSVWYVVCVSRYVCG